MLIDTIGPLAQSAKAAVPKAMATDNRACRGSRRIVHRKQRIIALIKADCGGGAFTRSIPPWLDATIANA
jgi:hypothetical protein